MGFKFTLLPSPRVESQDCCKKLLDPEDGHVNCNSLDSMTTL